MFFRRKDYTPRVDSNGFRQTVLARGGNIMLAEGEFSKGAVGASHSHPHEQIAYVSRGSFRFRIGKDEMEIHEGDSLFVPSGEEHECEALEDGSVIIDIFSPQREDFIKG